MNADARNAQFSQMKEFGQTPRQLFFNPHPRRATGNTTSDISRQVYTCGVSNQGQLGHGNTQAANDLHISCMVHHIMLDAAWLGGCTSASSVLPPPLPVLPAGGQYPSVCGALEPARSDSSGMWGQRVRYWVRVHNSSSVCDVCCHTVSLPRSFPRTAVMDSYVSCRLPGPVITDIVMARCRLPGPGLLCGALSHA